MGRGPYGVDIGSSDSLWHPSPFLSLVSPPYFAWMNSNKMEHYRLGSGYENKQIPVPPTQVAVGVLCRRICMAGGELGLSFSPIREMHLSGQEGLFEANLPPPLGSRFLPSINHLYCAYFSCTCFAANTSRTQRCLLTFAWQTYKVEFNGSSYLARFPGFQISFPMHIWTIFQQME